MALRIAKWICLQLRTGSPVYAIDGKLKTFLDQKDGIGLDALRKRKAFWEYLLSD
jgi:hypothetical protein